MRKLFLIPARGGSKGIPGKNIKPLAGKPLICYAIDVAREVASSQEDICVSTDDDEIIRLVEAYGLPIPFRRPAELSQDNSGSYEVIIHALEHYKAQGKSYDAVVLLQPTSPLRTATHVREAMELYSTDCDMVVSVAEAKSNPYYVMFQENQNGFLQHILKGTFVRRQDCPTVYEYNGAVYVMNVRSLHEKHLSEFTKNRKYVMPASASIDLDTPDDWRYAEYLMERELRKEEK